MTKQAQKILSGASAGFDSWSRTYRSFLEISFDYLRSTEEAEADIWMDTKLMYTEILDTMIRMSGIRDEWDGPKSMLLAVKAGLEVFYQSAKIESLYRFGTDDEGFFMSTDLFYAENIRKMNDGFWYRVAELSRLGKLDLWENIVFENTEMRREPHLHRKSKSVVYSMIRNSIALEHRYGSCEDLGALFIRWEYDTPWDELLLKGSHALRNLYGLNLELWKKRGKEFR